MNVDDMLDFVKIYVEVQHRNYIFYLRRHIHHIYEYSNSTNKGTKCGLKHCAGTVEPQNNFDVLTTELCNKATRDVAMRNIVR